MKISADKMAQAEIVQAPPRELVECGWSKNMDPAFLLAQENLTIFLKDGYSFFRATAEVLTQRFADPTKRTQIIIVHPDSPLMAAVANMDNNKMGFPKSQRSDCLQAVRILHEIRKRLLQEGKGDCADRVIFRGHDDVPTWNGSIGDEIATVNFYPTRPYRGDLLSEKGRKNGGKGSKRLYKWASDECTILLEQTMSPEKNLWNYQLPATLPDLRK